ncbi:hypothetical protein A9B99_13890 [Mangrovibacter phragmitis]|uniref:Uncharacterized protein n=1 Tax=Mangrovibacter phragmitis TaxID=1691903 RepID=A0A1B7KZ62_9ENTR|nr:hypothetical protein A9B99_13890 [Mangrovibacter phragmitis]
MHTLAEITYSVTAMVKRILSVIARRTKALFDRFIVSLKGVTASAIQEKMKNSNFWLFFIQSCCFPYY